MEAREGKYKARWGEYAFAAVPIIASATVQLLWLPSSEQPMCTTEGLDKVFGVCNRRGGESRRRTAGTLPSPTMQPH